MRVAGVVPVLAALIAAGCGTGGPVEGESASGGKEAFVASCGSCHTLADAGTQGTIGPNLDEAFRVAREEEYPESTIREVVRDQIRYPLSEKASPDVPAMPPNLVEGSQADAVAVYVASVAAKEVEGGQAAPPPAGGAADGKSIFLSAGCGSCHTLADAGTTGTIGPNLDESKPSVELAIDRVTNGSGAMPSFKDQLTEEQIRAVAEYVARASGR